MSKYTRGPWAAYITTHTVAVMKADSKKEVVHWSGFDSTDFPEQRNANARLIAAAPDLLEAGKKMLRELSDDGITSETAWMLKAAIDKAEAQS